MYRRAVKAILGKQYVDDYLDSVDTVEKAIERIAIVSLIQKEGGFDMRNWVSNNNLFLEKLPADSRSEGIVDMSTGQLLLFERMLCLIWNPSNDTFSLDLGMKKFSTKIVNGSIKPTKREVLRMIMTVHDPLGLLLLFTNASEKVFAVVTYLRATYDIHTTDVSFLAGKTTVAPLLPVSIPRIELQCPLVTIR